MDIDWIQLTRALVIGVFLGILYFGGLWLTVKALPRAANPVRLTVMSFVGRIGLVIGAMALITDGQATTLAAMLVGFMVVRFVSVYASRWKPSQTASS
jgi:F1F0 ATPase subunit 2